VKRLLAACGFGAARMTLALEEAEHPRGSNIHGRVTLTGGAVPQRVERLTIALLEYSQSGKSNALAQQTLPAPLTIEPRRLQAYAFSIEVPDAARLSLKTSFGTKETKILVTAAIPWAVNRRASVPVNIVPHREIVAVRQAMLALGFREQSGPGLKAVADAYAEGYWDAVIHRYDPPDSLSARLDNVKLLLDVERGVLTANVSVHHRARGLKETLGSLTGSTVDTSIIEIPCRELRDIEGRPRPDGATGRLAELLNKALAHPNDVRNSLLRASATPQSTPGQLLRPVASGGKTPVDELMRPVDANPKSGEPEIRT